MSDTPKITVIVPFYNAHETLARCLDAIVRELPPGGEVICVDDRSTDDSAQIAAQFDVRLVQMIRRSGAATARNLAASIAQGGIFFFLDADVIAPPGLPARVAAAFADDPELDALFGAYTIFPEAENFTSVYKNLVHHTTHLTSRREASTFWCGCGAIRREAFARVGGFDESYAAASVEDIDLGYRLNKTGAKIRLDPSLRVSHAKRYTLRSLIRSDLLDRAAPWAKLMARERVFKLDLNLKLANVLSGAVLALAAAAGIVLAALNPPALAAAALVALVVCAALNARVLWYVARLCGFWFSVKFFLMYVVTYFYSVIGLVLGLAEYLRERWRRDRTA
jgi:GT2 family glycosyltransferase